MLFVAPITELRNQTMRYAAALRIIAFLFFHTLALRCQDFINLLTKPQLLNCTQFTSIYVSEVNFTCCFLTGENKLQDGPTKALPIRTAFQGISSSQCVWCDYIPGTGGDENLKDLGALGDEAAPSHGTPTASSPRQQQEEQQPDLVTTLDLSSLSNILTVPLGGQLALHNLRIIGALLPTSPYPLPASSFMALSAFNIPPATAASTGSITTATAAPPSSPARIEATAASNSSSSNNNKTGVHQQQEQSQKPLQPPLLPSLILSDLVISTPSCHALLLHQAFACDASPSPFFTVTPTAIVVHRYSTPTASITNVTLTCDGEPSEPFKCLARRVSTGAELLQVMADSDEQVDAASKLQSRMVPMPVYIYLERDVTFSAAFPPAATNNNATSSTNITTTTTTRSSNSSEQLQQQLNNQPITVSISRFVIFGWPPSNNYSSTRVVLDLASITSLIEITGTASVQLSNLVLRNLPLGPPSGQQWKLLVLPIWTFSFDRYIITYTGAQMTLVNVTMELVREELALLFHNVLGEAAVPESLRGDLCVIDSSSSVMAMESQAVDVPGLGPSLLLQTATIMHGKGKLQDVILTVDGISPWCCEPSSSSGQGSSSSAIIATSSSSYVPPPPPACINKSALIGAVPLRPSICLYLPEGACGLPADIGNMQSVPDAHITTGSITGYLFWALFDTFAKPYSMWNIQGDMVILMWPNQNMSLESQKPALVKTPTTLMGSLVIMQTVIDASFLSGAIIVAAYSAASSTNASLTVRGVLFISLPAAGRYPEAKGTWAFPPAVTHPISPSSDVKLIMLDAQQQTQPRRSLISRQQQGGHQQGTSSPRMRDPNNELRPAALLQRNQQASERQQQTTRRRITSKRRKQLAVAPPSAATTATAAPTQGLDPVMSNFTSCLWTLDFDRFAAQARYNYLLQMYKSYDPPGSNVMTAMPPSAIPSGDAGDADDKRDDDKQRPMGLPYVFLDSVTLVIPQPELDVLIWSWANNSTAVATEPGLADQLDQMLMRSSLAADSAVAVSSRHSNIGPAVDTNSSYSSSSSSSINITRLEFQRFWWCGLEGRNVVLTSELPKRPKLLKHPPVRDLPVAYRPSRTTQDPQVPISIPSSSTKTPLLPSIATVPSHQRTVPSVVSHFSPPLPAAASEIAPSLAVSADDDDTRSRKANKVAPTAAIIGGTVVGAVCCTVAAVVVSGLLWWRRRQRGSSMNAVERSAPYIQKPSNMLGHAADDRVGELQQPAAYDGRRDQELDCNTATAMDIKSKGFINGDDYSPNLAQHQAVQQLKKGLNTSLNISFNSKQQPNNTKISGKTAACTAAADSIITPFELPPPPPPPPPPISIPPPRSSVLVGSSSKVTTTSVLHRAYMHMFQMFYRAEVNAAAGCKPQQAIISSGVAAMATSASHASNLSSLASAGPSQARRNNGIVVAAPAGSTAGAAVVRGSDDGGFMFAEGESSLIRQESGQLPRTMTTLPEMGPNSAGPTGSATASGSGELPLNGRTLNVPLTIVGELGRGAQGVVYRGIWRGLDVAVKSLLLRQEKCVMQVADAAQQLQEAAISASISHPNVVATYTYMLQPLGDELQPPSGQHNPTLADVSISKTSDHGHSNGNKLALGAAAAASVVAPLHIEVWKLTLVQELCEGNSLRHCLENGTLQTCRASRIYCAGHQQEHGGPYANPTCWAPHRLDVLRPLATLMTASPLAPAAAAADLPSTAAARAAHGGGSEGQEVSKETPPLPKLPSAAACHLDQQQQRLQQQQEPAATGHHGQQNTTSSTGSCLLQPAVMLMVALQVARGLEYLHFRGIVHGDVSSSNVLLKRAPDAVNPPSQPPVESLPSTASVRARDSWRRLPAFANGPATTVMRDPYVYGYIAKVCDFGLSGRLDSREDATHISGPARRNAAYSAPELVRDGRMSPAGDVYAFAVVLWELALGTPLSSLLQQPSRPESSGLRAWLAQQSFVELWDAEALPPDVLVWPEVARRIALAGLVEECLRAEPSARPTMTEVRKRLYGLLESLQLSE